METKEPNAYDDNGNPIRLSYSGGGMETKEPEGKKFRKNPVIISATQWFKNGDHPQDNCEMLKDQDGILFKSEGKIVRYYRNPADNDLHKCMYCDDIMLNHGWIDTLKGGHMVCPGDWIITGVQGEHYPIKDKIFLATYEKVEPEGGEVERLLKFICDMVAGVRSDSSCSFEIGRVEEQIKFLIKSSNKEAVEKERERIIKSFNGMFTRSLDGGDK